MNLILALRMKKEGLAKQVYEEQLVNGWPGLAQEVEHICLTIGLPSENSNLVTKNELNLALRNNDKANIEGKFSSYKKLDKIVGDDPTVAKEYMKEKAMADARLIFRLRTEMVEVKDNMRNSYKGTKVNCEACDYILHLPSLCWVEGAGAFVVDTGITLCIQ